ncbi:MAG: nucleotide pyrophosphohydrolase [Gammaproteobacteria bacterium]|uniref:nucleotide pyrophosphohydrolase n=1 Tax=Limnobacter sp. TaxID=2003368 RepID=UPI001DE117B3|nr:nucleotide pyrophosphohydrolase [Gammaproteobacteria bacterium]MBU0850005.1 nucleotide pyrophosphohydrolase [Gammaproteobacteria bacterium]MBU1268493.1 nucleotide pyrophosphohydrolase [Gammaproteobacteria bacterium]MBU1528041.1 nucleotide pyrophosphohydrolase [Gammaproteobacteria bacterium]MBU1781022.1 nucleotide pyrophosphohydrolase [Gammaproteobacteria bacterium]
MNSPTLKDLQLQLIDFANARNWGQFHSPKNLTMALSVEVAELMEHFQWMTEEHSRTVHGDKLDAVKEEVADVLLYLLQICNQLNIDPIEAAQQKLVKNAVKYPAA